MAALAVGSRLGAGAAFSPLIMVIAPLEAWRVQFALGVASNSPGGTRVDLLSCCSGKEDNYSRSRISLMNTLNLFYKGSSDSLILQTLKISPKLNISCSYSSS